MASVIQFKQIKPKRFQGSKAINILLGATRKAGNDIRKDFEETTKTWTNKPEFQMVYAVRPNGPEVLVGTDDKIYGYVNEGTKPHPIFPVRAKALRFQSGYAAKTVPGQLYSQAGGPFGATVFRAGVMHPGTKARKFDDIIQKLWESKFKTRIEQAMREAAEATDHLR